MNPEKQRIAIAEACGWKNVDAGAGRVWGFTTRHKGTPSESDVCVDVPNYPFDLNAMHDAEETLQESQRVTYSNELYDLAVEHQLKTGKWSYLSMTAAQRAEAFLRTIGKWEEAK
jgi:hypothetical protein